METNLRPKLKPRSIPVNELLLDPNNPRFMTDANAPVPEKDYATSGVQNEAAKRMRDERFKVNELVESIRSSGWQPVDLMFVRKLDDGHFVVVEGNRRLTALREILSDAETPQDLRNAVDPLHVVEVVGPPEIVNPQITYLLGVRHHGALKEWRPFAQAHNIYERYLRKGEMTDETFRWEEANAEAVATTLGMSVKMVKERVQVYRLMKQLEELPEVKETGMQGKYYSVIREVVVRPKRSKLREYVPQDPGTFRVPEITLRKLDTLCRFSTPNRDGAPIVNPAEWRSLERILADHDAEARERMLHEVEVDGRLPSDVYALRAAELRVPRWDQWLREVTDVLRKIQIADLDSTVEAVETGRMLAKVFDDVSRMIAKEATA